MHARGIPVIAIVSRAHASSGSARAAGATNLQDVADVVIDNGGAPGDAAVAIDGFAQRVGPTSTVVGAAALNAIVAEAAERLVARGIEPDVFLSSNVEGGDDVNARLLHGGDGAMKRVRRPRRHRGLLRHAVDAGAAARQHRVHRPRTA